MLLVLVAIVTLCQAIPTRMEPILVKLFKSIPMTCPPSTMYLATSQELHNFRQQIAMLGCTVSSAFWRVILDYL